MPVHSQHFELNYSVVDVPRTRINETRHVSVCLPTTATPPVTKALPDDDRDQRRKRDYLDDLAQHTPPPLDLDPGGPSPAPPLLNRSFSMPTTSQLLAGRGSLSRSFRRPVLANRPMPAEVFAAMHLSMLALLWAVMGALGVWQLVIWSLTDQCDNLRRYYLVSGVTGVGGAGVVVGFVLRCAHLLDRIRETRRPFPLASPRLLDEYHKVTGFTDTVLSAVVIVLCLWGIVLWSAGNIWVWSADTEQCEESAYQGRAMMIIMYGVVLVASVAAPLRAALTLQVPKGTASNMSMASPASPRMSIQSEAPMGGIPSPSSLPHSVVKSMRALAELQKDEMSHRVQRAQKALDVRGVVLGSKEHPLQSPFW